MKTLTTLFLVNFLCTISYGEIQPNPLEFNYAPAQTLGIINNKKLVELSGVVSGGINKDILWVHNDRHNLPRLYAMNHKVETVATYELDTFNDAGTMAGHWEDMARVKNKENGKYDLYIGDFGNNALEKRVHKILIVSEPGVDPSKASEVQKSQFKTISFQFPDDYICNSECLLVDPKTGRIYIISKAVKKGSQKVSGNFLWSLPEIHSLDKTYTAHLELSSIPAVKTEKVTGGDISADGQSLILRTTKSTAFLWQINNEPLKQVIAKTPMKVLLAKEKGGEAICFSLDRSTLYTIYDGKKENRPVHAYKKK